MPNMVVKLGLFAVLLVSVFASVKQAQSQQFAPLCIISHGTCLTGACVNDCIGGGACHCPK